MLKKILPVLMLLIIWTAAPAWAQGGRPAAPESVLPADNPIYQQPGAQAQCYSGLNGRGKVIKWAKTKEQCRNQTNGQSWGHSGHYENYLHESPFR